MTKKRDNRDGYLAGFGLGGTALGGALGAGHAHETLGLEDDALRYIKDISGRNSDELLREMMGDVGKPHDPSRYKTLDVAFSGTPERSVPSTKVASALDRFLAKAGMGAKGKRYLSGGLKGAALGGLAGLGVGGLASLLRGNE